MPTTPTAATGDLNVMTNQTGLELQGSVLALPSGGFAVAYLSDAGGTARAYLQFFDETGAMSGTPILLASGVNSYNSVSLIRLTTCELVASWHDGGQNAYIQRMQSDGTAIGSPVAVTGYAASGLTALANGGFVYASIWNASSTRLSFFDAAGGLITTLVTPASTVSVTLLDDGNIFAAYNGTGGQIYTPSGATVGAFFDISEFDVGVSGGVAATLADGRVVVAFTESNAGLANDVSFRIMNADGTPASGQISVVSAAGRQESPAVLALNDGGFIVTWYDLTGADGGGEGILARRYDSSGALVGDTFVVAAAGASANQTYSRLYSQPVAQLQDGGAVFLFSTQNATWDLRVRLFDIDGNPQGATQGTGGDDVMDGTAGVDNFAAGAGADTLNGLGGDDILNGQGGDDIIDGGTGADLMTGGDGSDTFYVDDAGDQTLEAAGQGTDTVIASIDWTLADNVENLTLTGTAIQGTGNALDNIITGNDQNNTLNGLDGNDRLLGGLGADTLNGGDGNDFLDGGAGADILEGGLGNDIYIVDDVGDVVVELDGGGSERIRASVNFTLTPYLDNLQLSGTAIQGIGNDLGNQIDGNDQDNDLQGMNGADIVRGYLGADSINGGDGNDILLGGDGDDDINGDLANDIIYGEAGDDELYGEGGLDILDGGDGNDRLGGGDGNDQLLGGADTDILFGEAGNDRLDGGAGADEMYGGLDNDTYFVDDVGDFCSEAENEGTDTVRASVTYTLNDNIERLVLEGSGSIDGTGNNLDNSITGNAGANILSGAGGDDLIKGGDGNDTLYGGADDDQLLGEFGFDTLYGGDGNDRLDGGDLGDTLYGDAGNDILLGGNGNDILYGGTGNDTLLGGNGADTFVVLAESLYSSAAPGGRSLETDTISDFTAGLDRINLSAIDAIPGGADNAFTLVASFSGAGGEMTLQFNGTRTLLSLDVDGDGKADYQMKINGDVTEATGNWIL